MNWSFAIFQHAFSHSHQIANSHQIVGGKFALQLTEKSNFSHIETDKVIEMTLNEATKTPDNH